MIEIGQKIKAAREQTGIALEEIASRTRIGLTYLREIEQGKFDFLPRPYVLAFTKTFANQVGLNGEEISKQLQATLAGPSVTEAPLTPTQVQYEARPEPEFVSSSARQSPEPQPASMPYLREVLLGLGIIVVVVIALFMVSNSSEEQATSAEDGTQTSTRSANNAQEMSFEEMAKRVAAVADSQARAEIVEPQKLTLEARLEAPVWMRVITDNADTVFSTYPKGNVQWQAKENFVLRVGNAGAVTFVLDGKVLGKVGNYGQRVNVSVTREGFKEKRILPPPRPRSTRADSSGT